MAYRSYLHRKHNPEHRTITKRREKVRKRLRELSILPPAGDIMNETQEKIYNEIGNDNYEFWNSIKKNGNGRDKIHDGGTQKKIDIKSIEYIIWYRAKSNAKNKGFDFDLCVEDIIIPEYCPYLNVKIVFDFNFNNYDDYVSIDRIDSSKGYIKGNVQIISRLANTMKNHASIDQLKTFAKNVLRIHQ